MLKAKFLKLFFVTIHSLSLLSVFHPAVRGALKSAIRGNSRTVLSSVNTKLDTSETQYNILKVRSEGNLFLEVYSTDKLGGISLLEKVQLPDDHDAYFNFGGTMSNLIVADVERAGLPQIVVPSFDKDLVGHLNIFQFDSASHTLMKFNR